MKTLFISLQSFCALFLRNDQIDYSMLSAPVSIRIKTEYLETGQIWKAGDVHGV